MGDYNSMWPYIIDDLVKNPLEGKSYSSLFFKIYTSLRRNSKFIDVNIPLIFKKAVDMGVRLGLFKMRNGIIRLALKMPRQADRKSCAQERGMSKQRCRCMSKLCEMLAHSDPPEERNRGMDESRNRSNTSSFVSRVKFGRMYSDDNRFGKQSRKEPKPEPVFTIHGGLKRAHISKRNRIEVAKKKKKRIVKKKKDRKRPYKCQRDEGNVKP